MPQTRPPLTFSTSERCLYRDWAQEEHLPLVCWGGGLLYGGQVRAGGQERRKEEERRGRRMKGKEQEGEGIRELKEVG